MTRKKATPLAIFYGVFAAAGAIVPWYFNIVWMRETGSLLTPSALVNASPVVRIRSTPGGLAVGTSVPGNPREFAVIT